MEDEEDPGPPSLIGLFGLDGPFGLQRPPKSSINTAPKVSPKASKVRSLPAAATVPQKIRTHVRGDALRGPATPQQTRGSPIATGPADVVTGPAVDLRKLAAPKPSFNNHGDNDEENENSILDGRYVRAIKGINDVNTKVEPTLDIRNAIFTSRGL